MKPNLLALINFIQRHVDERKSKSLLKIDTHLYSQSKVIEFDYADGSIRNMGWNIDQIVKDEWNLMDLTRFIDDVVEISSEFRNCVDSILKMPSLSVDNEIRDENPTNEQRKNVIQSRLKDFCRTVALQTFSETLPEKRAIELIDSLLTDITGQPIEWTVNAQIQGVWVYPEQIQLSEKVILRQPTGTDLEEVVRIDMLPFRNSVSLGHPRFRSVLLFSVDGGKFGREPQNELRLLIDLLCLFNVGSVMSLKNSQFSYPSIRPGFISEPEAKSELYHYRMNADDVIIWVNFDNLFRPFIQELHSLPMHIQIAHERYKDGLFERNIDARIALSVYGLEALYLDKGQELKFRLRFRVAALLKQVGFEPLTVYQNIGHAYDFRSDYSHGDISNKKKEIKPEVCREVLNYLRVSLLIFLQMNRKKGSLLELIDKSLLDDSSLEEMKEFAANLFISNIIDSETTAQ